MQSKIMRVGWIVRRRGAAIVELALTLTILFAICYGTIEFGYYFFVKNTEAGAAREGCRAGIVSGATDSSVTAAAETSLQNAGLVANGTSVTGSSSPCTIGNYTVTISPAVASCSIGSTLTVTVSATWGTVGAGFRPEAIIAANKSVTVSCSMRKEG